MNWYLVKIVFRILCGNGDHTPQFDEQLRLIKANNELEAFQKARKLGELEEDSFLNTRQKPVQWKFIDVSELFLVSELSDGIEMYSQVLEDDQGERYIEGIKTRAGKLFQKYQQQTLLQ